MLKKFLSLPKKIFSWFKNLSLIKKIIIILIFVGAIYFAYQKISSKEASPQYQFAVVEKGTIADVVSETGEIMTVSKVEVPSTIEGIVEEVYVDNGQIIAKGDDLYSVVSTATAEERASAYASYLSAKAGLESAKATQYTVQADMLQKWDDFKELAESDDYKDTDSVNRNLPEFHIPEKEWLGAEAKYKNQEQLINEAQASLTKAWLTYQSMIDGVVKSPSAGTVANLAVAPGQFVDTETSSLLVQSQAETWVQISVNESEIISIEPGQTATFEVDALANGSKNKFKGVVKRVDNIGTVDSGVVLYNVYLTVDQINSKVLAGMTVQVDIETQKKENILVVPNSAIKPYQGSKAVQVLDPQTNEILYMPIEVGVVGDDTTEVLSGLEEGQQIIVGSATGTTSSTGSGSGQGGGGGMGIIPGAARP